MYDLSLKIARDIYNFESSHIEETRNINNEFEFGISVCLLCRNYILINDKEQAKTVIKQYVSNKKHFLEDMRDIKSIFKKEELTGRDKEFIQKKVELIASIANILCELK